MKARNHPKQLRKFSCVLNTKGLHAGEHQYIGISVYHKEFVKGIKKPFTNSTF
ncbi:hypothetical protein OCC_14445 [Thermococcus litoralis DSM 5473]|jgi:hypothetical protein|uniref:Uncharacterized protein n=1 Tax=Thermococcus litoralis (strain ATCC 51850 / DSM 5473 / JCM 8560 / NS-C) TaxID=523849 RepID=S5Z524_THELN|nr:hypothetical protein OCC_14445 [Thermococcus litoralis DSM 5473]MDN5321006.1 hypothetical protein [Thermococcaceae archaeon]